MGRIGRGTADPDDHADADEHPDDHIDTGEHSDDHIEPDKSHTDADSDEDADIFSADPDDPHHADVHVYPDERTNGWCRLRR